MSQPRQRGGDEKEELLQRQSIMQQNTTTPHAQPVEKYKHNKTQQTTAQRETLEHATRTDSHSNCCTMKELIMTQQAADVSQPLVMAVMAVLVALVCFE
jgi:hypothetical protein